MRRLVLLLLCIIVLVDASQCSAQIIFHKKKKVNKSTDASNTVEPDKQLYDKAMDDIKHGKHETGRLGLQTLINTYPDSPYAQKAESILQDQRFSGCREFVSFSGTCETKIRLEPPDETSPMKFLDTD